jgi:hypothetical protein
VIAALAGVALSAAPARAQDEKSDVRLANLQTILITADKTQPRSYKPDDKTAALLAEIAREEAPKDAGAKAKK